MKPTQAGFGNHVSADVIRKRLADTDLKIAGHFVIEHYNKAGKLLNAFKVPNGVVNEGLDAVLDIMFHADTQITTWYLAFIDASGFSALAAGDTMSSHAGWTEFTSYSEANRPTWPEDAASSQTIANSTPVDFNINGTGTLKGVFCTSQNTKGGTTGTLWATALFTGDIPVTSGDLIKITYTVQAS